MPTNPIKRVVQIDGHHIATTAWHQVQAGVLGGAKEVSEEAPDRPGSNPTLQNKSPVIFKAVNDRKRTERLRNGFTPEEAKQT